MNAPANVFGLAVTVPEPYDARAAVLVDGVDVFGPLGYAGFDAGWLLDSGALLPDDEPRRVCVATCTCYIAGCGTVTALIARDGRTVVWSDFRDYASAYHDWDPVADEQWLHDKWRPVQAGPYVFDAEQYAAAVAAAGADRWWETPARRTARLLRAHLGAPPLATAFARRGWRPDSVVFPDHPDEDVFVLRVYAGAERVLTLWLPAPPGGPDERAARLAADLAATDPGAWAAAYPKPR